MATPVDAGNVGDGVGSGSSMRLMIDAALKDHPHMYAMVDTVAGYFIEVRHMHNTIHTYVCSHAEVNILLEWLQGAT
jgi:hypothetical protein